MAFIGQYNRCAIWQDGRGDRLDFGLLPLRGSRDFIPNFPVVSPPANIRRPSGTEGWAANRYAEETRIPDLFSGSTRAPVGLLAARQPGGDGLPLRGDFAARRSGRRVRGASSAGRSRQA